MDLLGCCERQCGLGISLRQTRGRMGMCPEHPGDTEAEHQGQLGALRQLHTCPCMPGLAFPPLLSSDLQDNCKKSPRLSRGFQLWKIAELLIPHGPFHPLGRCKVWGTAGAPSATPPWEQRAPRATHQMEERKQYWQQHVPLARQRDVPEAEGRKEDTYSSSRGKSILKMLNNILP